MTDPKDDVEQLLDEMPPKASGNIIDNKHPKLAAAIKHFMDLKASGDERAIGLTFYWFYREKLLPRFGGPTVQTAAGWIRDRLKRDHRTGKPIDD